MQLTQCDLQVLLDAARARWEALSDSARDHTLRELAGEELEPMVLEKLPADLRRASDDFVLVLEQVQAERDVRLRQQ